MLIYKQRFMRAVEALRKHSIDAWVIVGRETYMLREPAFMYLLPVDPFPRTAVIITAAGDRTCITSRMECEEMYDLGLFNQIVVHNADAPYEYRIAEAIKSFMPLNRIALNISGSDPSSDGLTHSNYSMLSRCFSDAGFAGEIVSSAPIMKEVRGHKSDEEVGRIAKAVSCAMEVYKEARLLMRTGISGRDVQRIFQDIVDDKGYEFSWQKRGNPYVSVGARSSYLCRRPPADVYIQPGDLVNVDLGIRVDGFASDNQRSFFAPLDGASPLPDEVKRAWETVQPINREVCSAMKIGISSAALTEVGNRVMLENGYETGWSSGFGHEIGMFAHNGGITLGRGTPVDLDDTLEENMVFTSEPAILTSYGRLCQEEVVCVTRAGGVMLSTPQDEVWMIK